MRRLVKRGMKPAIDFVKERMISDFAWAVRTHQDTFGNRYNETS
jgi:hypothetical protein